MNSSPTLIAWLFALCLRIPVVAAETNSFTVDVKQGNVRVVLMSVGQTTVFPNEVDRAAKGQPWGAPERSTHDAGGVPCFTVTFLVEALGTGPFERKMLKEIQIFQGEQAVPSVNRRGDYQEWFDYHIFPGFLDFTKPKVTNPARAFVMRYVRFGSLSTLEPLALRIRTGFDENVEEFNFESIKFQ